MGRYGFFLLLALFAARSEAAVDPLRDIAAAMKLECRDLDDSETPEAALEELCGCLTAADPAGAASLCAAGGDLATWGAHVDGWLGLGETVPAAPECRTALRRRSVERFYRWLGKRCRTSPAIAAKLSVFPASMKQGAECWRLTGMTADGCLEARSCDAFGARLSALGVSGPEGLEYRREARVCNGRLTALNRMRDPEGRTYGFQRPFVQALLDNAHYPHGEGTYAQANCHGTAEYLAGGFLRDVPVSEVRVAPFYRKECEPIATARYGAARALSPTGTPRVADIAASQHVAINMTYGSCSESDCGKTSYWTNRCERGVLQDYVFIDGMCVTCWDKRLREAGYRRLAADASWTELRPGCLLTMNDHSVTVVGVFEGMCYHYDAPNPGGPPRLLAAPCPSFLARFPARWCPATPMAFKL